MITTTPIAQPAAQRHARNPSQSRVPSRPTTPLRPTSRASLRASHNTPSGNIAQDVVNTGGIIGFPLAQLEPAFAELSDSMADLEANFMHLQLLNESIARFNENFASFLYGLNMTAFCVDFPEAPITHSFDRHGSNTCQMKDSPFREVRTTIEIHQATNDGGTDATFMTGDTSFVDNPPASTKSANKINTQPGRRGTTRGGYVPSRGMASTRGKVPVAGVDESGRRTTRLPAGPNRGISRGSAVRGRGYTR